MELQIVAWMILRIMYAWMFLYPLKVLLSDWQVTKNTVALIVPKRLVPLSSILMVIVMIIGALSILLGFYAQIGGLLLLVYCLMGAVVHYKLAKLIINHQAIANQSNNAALQEVIDMGVVGNVSSAQKNFVLAAVAFFFMLLGSGPMSLTAPFFQPWIVY